MGLPTLCPWICANQLNLIQYSVQNPFLYVQPINLAGISKINELISSSDIFSYSSNINLLSPYCWVGCFGVPSRPWTNCRDYSVTALRLGVRGSVKQQPTPAENRSSNTTILHNRISMTLNFLFTSKKNSIYLTIIFIYRVIYVVVSRLQTTGHRSRQSVLPGTTYHKKIVSPRERTPRRTTRTPVSGLFCLSSYLRQVLS